MSGTIGKLIKHLLIWAAMALLVLVFGVTGVEIGNFAQSSALKVGQERFSAIDLSRELTRQISALRNRTGESLTQEEAISRGLGAEVIEYLTQRALINADSKSLTITAPESEIRKYLNKNPNFQNKVTGKFDQTVLNNILRGNNISIEEFKEIISQELQRTQLSTALGTPVATNDIFIKSLILRESELRDISFTRLSAKDLAALPTPTDEDLLLTYETNVEEFISEEYRTFDLVIFNADAFTDNLDVSEDSLRALYESEKEQYDTPETRVIRQIPFSTEQDAALALKRLNSGISLEVLAAERGQTLEDITFENVTADSLPDISISGTLFGTNQTGAYLGPIKSLFGYTIAEIVSITEGTTRSFEDVREIIREEEQSEIVEQRIIDAVDIVELARNEGASLVEALAEIPEIKLQRIGPVDNVGHDKSNISASIAPEILAEVFLLEEGEESLALDLSDGGYFIASIEQIEDAALNPFQTVKDDVLRLWREQETQKSLEAKVASIMEELEAGGSFEDVTKENSLRVEKRTLALSNADTLPRRTVTQLFNAQLNQVIRSSSDNSDDIIIALVTAARFEQKPGLENLERLYRESYTTQLGQELYNAYYRTLERELGVTQNQNQIAAAFNQSQ